MNILFVCTGNICRSTAAEYLLKDYAKKNKIKNINVMSAGTDTGIPNVTNHAITVFDEYKIPEIRDHKPQQVNNELISRADIVLVMTQYHKDSISENTNNTKKVYLFNEFIYGKKEDIPDPFQQNLETYRECFDYIRKAIPVLVNKIENYTK